MDRYKITLHWESTFNRSVDEKNTVEHKSDSSYEAFGAAVHSLRHKLAGFRLTNFIVSKMVLKEVETLKAFS